LAHAATYENLVSREPWNIVSTYTAGSSSSRDQRAEHGSHSIRALMASGDFPVPAHLSVENLAHYLEELFHESATPERPAVLRLIE
jgi:hypothetical protein